jgi:hypothetical protein
MPVMLVRQSCCAMPLSPSPHLGQVELLLLDLPLALDVNHQQARARQALAVLWGLALRGSRGSRGSR